jgi:hypothetical protein
MHILRHKSLRTARVSQTTDGNTIHQKAYNAYVCDESQSMIQSSSFTQKNLKSDRIIVMIRFILADTQVVSVKSLFDVATPIVAIATTLFLGLCAIVAYFFRRLVNQVDSISNDIKPIRPAIIELQNLVATKAPPPNNYSHIKTR